MILTKIWFADNRIYGLNENGQTVFQSLLYYKNLLKATPEQREKYRIGKMGIHWEELDEDISFESFGYDNPEPIGISKFFLSHPEINASAIARRLGIQQSLLASYINGTKKPSKERENSIMAEVKALGIELQKATL